MKIAFFITIISCSTLFGGTLYRLPIKSEIGDSSVITTYEEAIDQVFTTLPGKEFTVIIPQNPDSFPADSTVCSGAIETADSSNLTFKLDFFFAGTAVDSTWSCTFTLRDDQVSRKKLIRSIIRSLQTKGFPGLFLSRLQILGANGAEVLIDSAVTEFKVPFERFLPSGSYLIEIRKNWIVREEFTLDLSAGRDTAITIDFWKKTAKLRYGLIATGVVCLAGGMYLHYYQDNTYDIYYNEKQDENKMTSLYRKYQAAVIGRNSLLTIGGFGIISSLAIAFSIPF